jgi:TonB family protein
MAPLLLLGALAALQTAPRPVERPLLPLITREDYPGEALRHEWTGAVRVRLEVDETGGVARCTVILSSGHAILDAQTCTLVQARARFVPATDADGRATVGSVTLVVHWRIEEAHDPALRAARERWLDCLASAARPLLASGRQPFEIADAAIGLCPAQEEQVVLAGRALGKHGHPKNAYEARYGLRPDLILRIDWMQSEARSPPDGK